MVLLGACLRNVSMGDVLPESVALWIRHALAFKVQSKCGRLLRPHPACRGVAQSGSASALGAEGRGFESLRPDHYNTKIEEIATATVLAWVLSILRLCQEWPWSFRSPLICDLSDDRIRIAARSWKLASRNLSVNR